MDSVQQDSLLVYFPEVEKGSEQNLSTLLLPPVPTSTAGPARASLLGRDAAVLSVCLSSPGGPPHKNVGATAWTYLESLRKAVANMADDVNGPWKNAYVCSRPSSDATHRAALLSVEGMTCGSCVRLIEDTLLGPSVAGGVVGARASLKRGECFVEYDSARLSAEALRGAVYDMGFGCSVLACYYDKNLDPLASQGNNNSGPLVPCMPQENNIVAHRATSTTLSTTGEMEGGTPCNNDAINGLPIACRQRVVLMAVEGMVCQSCVQNIEGNLSIKEGVKSVCVTLKPGQATIEYEASVTTAEEMRSAIEDLGFDARIVEEREGEGEGGGGERKVCYVGIEGMTCHSCVSLIESALSEVGGVTGVSVSLPNKEGRVEYVVGGEGMGVSQEELKRTVEDLGFIVTYTSGTHTHTHTILYFTHTHTQSAHFCMFMYKPQLNVCACTWLANSWFVASILVLFT